MNSLAGSAWDDNLPRSDDSFEEDQAAGVEAATHYSADSLEWPACLQSWEDTETTLPPAPHPSPVLEPRSPERQEPISPEIPDNQNLSPQMLTRNMRRKMLENEALTFKEFERRPGAASTPRNREMQQSFLREIDSSRINEEIVELEESQNFCSTCGTTLLSHEDCMCQQHSKSLGQM